MRRSMLPYSQVMRIEALFLRGRTELAAGRGGAAARSARRIRRERTSYGEPLADLLAAGVAGRQERARLLRRAADGFARVDMQLLAVAARRRLGELAGDESEVEAADAWMTSREIARPRRMVAMLAPLG